MQYGINCAIIKKIKPFTAQGEILENLKPSLKVTENLIKFASLATHCCSRETASSASYSLLLALIYLCSSQAIQVM